MEYETETINSPTGKVFKVCLNIHIEHSISLVTVEINNNYNKNDIIFHNFIFHNCISV